MAVEQTRRARTQAERKAESAHELMRAAVELIAERGWEQSSSAEIARRAGYSITMVNARYGSREGLLAALLQGYEERFELGGPRRERGLDELLDRVEILREQVRSEPALLRAFLMLCFDSVGPAVGHRKWIEAWFDRYTRDLAAIIGRGQVDGSIRDDVDADAEARFFLDAGTGICYAWLLGRRTSIDEDLLGLSRRTQALLGLRKRGRQPSKRLST